MKQIIGDLVALQKLQLGPKPQLAPDNAEILALQARVPLLMLERFNRFIARGKKGVAVIRNGICSECHLRITSGTLARLGDATQIQVCDNCGRYLEATEPAELPLPKNASARA